ncbi:hypothetical protein TRFO_36477 [Tritrichomonas foetus]|uniref:Uncharacterized protein n=1 Tax=Tritrichomonas foetus TaxID=1144522 RepID=A0A1J4JDQ3_9EUKA|nr:hypothetical protein TRFO_36477 [Tritrichomonas foetus]|eukprot:OHS97326.1 hypothetical protein TRFO_36477 [Tritrichomonas foetus]
MSVTEKDILQLLDIYEQYRSNITDDNSMIEFGKNLNKAVIRDYLSLSIMKDLSPDKVLEAIFESINDEQTKLIRGTISVAVSQIIRWNFASIDRGRTFSLKLCKIVPQVSGMKTSFKILNNIIKCCCKLSHNEKNPYAVEALLSIIPPVFHTLYKEQGKIKINDEELSCHEQCKKWLDEIFQSNFPSFMIPYVIETFTDLPLTEEQITAFVDNILLSTNFLHLPSIAEKLFPALRKYPKLTHDSLLRLMKAALQVEREDFRGEKIENVRTQCQLIKVLFTVANMSKTVLDSLVKILTSNTELPTHFTPFLVSLAFDASRLNPKIKEATQKFFLERIKDDSMRVRSRFLEHLYSKDLNAFSTKDLENIMSYAISLSKRNLETNAHNFIEFAFNLIDNSKSGPGFRRGPVNYTESSSNFIPDSVRQIEIGIRILRDCLDSFVSSSSEIFSQIVQRLISNSQNSVYLVQCLDSPENLLEVIDYMQYLELPVVEQLMRYAVPKICGNEVYLDRAILAARKAFFNRTEKAKLNGVAALFYLILPRQEQTFTQVVAIDGKDDFDERVGAATNEDTQHDIFASMRRGFTQSDAVQADIYFFIPFLLKQCPELNIVVCSAFREKLDSILHEGAFPLIISPSVPHFLYCLSRCLYNIPNAILQHDDWDELNKLLTTLCDDLSRVDFEYLLDQMELFNHPDDRESVIAIISVLFNHTFTIDKDTALALFRLYERITHKKAEINRQRKDELKSELKFPYFMELNMLKELLKLLEQKNGDYFDNYGIQLYALEHAKEMINELPDLRLEMRSERLKRAMTLGQILYDSYENVHWTDPPAGFKTNASLPDILTTSLRQLFTFIFETYKDKYVEKFLKETAIIAPNEKIVNAHKLILQKIKQSVSAKNAKTADNFCAIAEMISLLSFYDFRNYQTVKKILTRLIQSNSPFAGRILRLARFYCPKDNFDWLFEITDIIVEKADEIDEASASSSALLEMIVTCSVYLDDIKWAIKVWIPQINAANPDESAKYSSKFSVFLMQIAEILEKLLQIDFKKFPPNYYESIIKFVNDFYNELNKLLKQTLLLQNTTNDALEGLVKKITSEFDEKIINFTIANQVNDGKSHKGISRQDRFDATQAPKLHFYIDKFRTTVKTMVEKKLLSEELLDSFCRLRGTDVKLPSSRKKKKQHFIKGEDLDDAEMQHNNHSNDEHQEEHDENGEDDDQDEEQQDQDNEDL